MYIITILLYIIKMSHNLDIFLDQSVSSTILPINVIQYYNNFLNEHQFNNINIHIVSDNCSTIISNQSTTYCLNIDVKNIIYNILCNKSINLPNKLEIIYSAILNIEKKSSSNDTILIIISGKDLIENKDLIIKLKDWIKSQSRYNIYFFMGETEFTYIISHFTKLSNRFHHIVLKKIFQELITSNVYIKNYYVGYIIGKNKNTINKIMFDHQVQIIYPSIDINKKPDDIVTFIIKGSTKDVLNAKNTIINLEKYFMEQYPLDTILDVEIYGKIAGIIIGVKGANIISIQNRFNIKIISPDPSQRYKEIVTFKLISKDRSSIEAAKNELLRIQNLSLKNMNIH